jgi:hypothetical protein
MQLSTMNTCTRDRTPPCDDDDDDAVSASSKLSVSSDKESTLGITESDDKEDYNEVKNLSRKENEAVAMWRELVTGMLVITACLMTCGTYIYLMRSETATFTLNVSDGAPFCSIPCLNFKLRLV